MDLFIFFVCIFLAIIGAGPVLLIRRFFAKKDFSIYSYILLITLLLTITIAIYSLYYYLISSNINMIDFYPVTKTMEMLIPAMVSILVYGVKPKLFTYVGVTFSVLGVIFLTV
jgi:drug/metabolite transporter (DMT)-like permease